MSEMRTTGLFFLLLLLPFMGLSQVKTANDSLITVKGRVIDPTKTVAFYNMVVVNKALGKGIFGDYNGEFEITLRKGDPVGISVVGYNSVTLSFADSAYKPVYNVTVTLKML